MSQLVIHNLSTIHPIHSYLVIKASCHHQSGQTTTAATRLPWGQIYFSVEPIMALVRLTSSWVYISWADVHMSLYLLVWLMYTWVCWLGCCTHESILVGLMYTWVCICWADVHRSLYSLVWLTYTWVNLLVGLGYTWICIYQVFPLNFQDPQPGETPKMAMSRALMFDISFLLLCHIVQLYGIDVSQEH